MNDWPIVAWHAWRRDVALGYGPGLWIRVRGWGMWVGIVECGVFVPPFSERFGYARAWYVGPVRIKFLRPERT